MTLLQIPLLSLAGAMVLQPGLMLGRRQGDTGKVNSDALLVSLRAAVEAAPDDIALRLHLAEMLKSAGHQSEAVRHAAAVLQANPENAQALRLIGAGSPISDEDSSSDSAAETLRRL